MGHKILVVEDKPIYRYTYKKGLEDADFEVEEAPNEKEAEQMLGRVMEALDKSDIEAARLALVNERNLNQMQMDFRRSHVDRMSEGICTAETGLIFIDLVDNVEKIGDHLTNIAQAVIGGLHWNGIDVKAQADS